MLLWALIGLVLARGLGDLLSGPSGQPAPRESWQAATLAGDRARAFAAGFARVYLESPSARALRPYLAPGLAAELGSTLGRKRVRVAQATPAGERVLGPGRVLITVACQLTGGRGTLYLAVPIGRDPAGGLAVSGLPSLVAPPPTGRVDAEEAQPLAGDEAEAIRRLAGRFLAAYLPGVGGGGELAYLVAPGSALAPVAGVKLVEMIEVGELGDRAGGRRTMLARARVRDLKSGATYPVAYRLELVRRERWYVAGVEGALR